jgi:formamidopyrimidine-DNA glycosylase
VRFEVGKEAPVWWRDLPPALESADFRRVDLDAFLERRKGSPLKAVLLMQERFPGIGNWMADEILWRSRLHPGRKAGSLSPDERVRLYREIRVVVRGALKHISRPGDHWGDPPAGWLFHQRWLDGGICPKTGARLERTTIGGRTTCWSPTWQR